MIIKKLLSLSAILGASLLTPAISSAAVIFTNFGPSFAYDTANYELVGNAFDGNNYAEGDTFKPSASATFGTLRIALSCFATCSDPFSVSLRRDSGSDSPGAAIEIFTVAATSLGTVGSNNPPLVLTSTLFPTLTSGTQYWISVQSDTNNSIAWSDNNTGDTSDQAISTDGGATYFSPSALTPSAYEVDSRVSTATPEPSTVILLSGTLPLLFFLRRRLR